MALGHADLLRTLPAALEGCPHEVSGNVITIRGEGRQVVIRLSPERERRLAALRLPVTVLDFRFAGYSREEVDAFMKRFDRCFQRGGG